MKKILISVLALLAVVVLVPTAVMFFSFHGNSTIQDGAVLNNFATTIKETMVSCFMFEPYKGAVVLVDAGMDPEGKAILTALKKRGLGPDAVKAVFLTHGDGDHVGACPLFKNAKIYCNEADVAIAEGREKPKKPISFLFSVKPRGFKVTNILKDGQDIWFGTCNVKGFAVPGHTAGSMVFLAQGVLFMGDSCNADTQGHLTPATRIFSQNMSQDRASLKALAERLKPLQEKIKVIAPSHTGPLMGLQPLLDFAETVK